jgi:phosphocarrier protein
MSARKKARGKTKRPKRANKVVRSVRIVNKLGLHARPSAMFVQTANRFPDCRITVSNDSERVNGKSIMGMMTLAAAYDSELTLEIVGNQADEAADALTQLIADKFEEE